MYGQLPYTVGPVLALSHRGPMITRITRGTLRPNTEGRVFEVLRDATRANPRPPGLLGVSISRHVNGTVTELVAVSIWSDVDAMTAVLGEKWREPTWLPGLTESIVDSRLEILETVVSSYEELTTAAAE
jgi:hypothetical protein